MSVSNITEETIVIYTDGACQGNPGPGGWGASVKQGDQYDELKGGDSDTTNNKMEMTAAIEALQFIQKNTHPIELYTDSEYVQKGITEWIHGWKLKGWKNAKKRPVANADLWKQLDELNQFHSVDWRWVKGHAGDPGNERADELANIGLREANKAMWED